MIRPISEDLLKRVARQDFIDQVRSHMIGARLKPRWKREAFALGLYQPTHAETADALRALELEDRQVGQRPDEWVMGQILRNDLFAVLNVIEEFLSLGSERERMRFVFGGP